MSEAVSKLEEIPPGQSKLVTVDGKEVALFNVEGTLYALGNRCAHRSGPLVRGKIEKVPGTETVPGTLVSTLAVRCPIHGWLFELATGRCLTRPGADVPSFPVRCENAEVCLG